MSREPSPIEPEGGRRLPGIIASVFAESTRQATEDIERAARGGADAVELRLDAPGSREPFRLMDAARGVGLPVIATCRRTDDGGLFSGREPLRTRLLEAAAQAGAAYVDAEAGSEAAAHLSTSRPPGCGLILSEHFGGSEPDASAGAPSRGEAGSVRARLARLERGAVPGGASPGSSSGARADALKLVIQARGPLDLVEIRDALERRREAVPLVLFASGAAGIATRVLALAWGSAAVYVAADAARPAGEGQLGIEEALSVYDVRGIGAHTSLYALTGSHIGRSLSPALHNAAFRASRLDARYVPLAASNIEEALGACRALGVAGMSVTAPHKEAAARVCDVLDDAAARAGSVNTLTFRGGRVHGASTDGPACVRVIERRLPVRGARVLLLGAGGAGRALAFALAGAGADLRIFNRTAERADRLARDAGAAAITAGELAGMAWDVLVNATSAGTGDAPGEDELPFPADTVDLANGRLVLDLVYGSPPTRIVREASALGVRALDGGEMLVEQALGQLSIWRDALPDGPPGECAGADENAPDAQGSQGARNVSEAARRAMSEALARAMIRPAGGANRQRG